MRILGVKFSLILIVSCSPLLLNTCFLASYSRAISGSGSDPPSLVPLVDAQEAFEAVTRTPTFSKVRNCEIISEQKKKQSI